MEFFASKPADIHGTGKPFAGNSEAVPGHAEPNA